MSLPRKFGLNANRILVLLRGLIRKTYIYGLFYTFVREHFPVQKNTVLLESHLGVDFIGSPRAIARHLLDCDDYSSLKLILVCPKAVRRTLSQLHPEARIRRCNKNSLRYACFLAISEWLVNDSTFPYYFSRRPNQRYLNTWHGTPLKTLGRKVSTEIFRHTGNIQRNFFHASALLAPNPHTECALLSDYMLSGIWRGKILHCGYPRNDVLYQARDTRTDHRTLDIAFMPTWRGQITGRKLASQHQLAELQTLLERLDEAVSDNVTLWVRLHPLVKGHLDITQLTHLRPFPPELDPYEHLAKCDALITDYSSVIFDFAVTGRPILLYTDDMKSYQKERGFYLDMQELPFERAESPELLIQKITILVKQLSEGNPNVTPAYQSFIEKYCVWDDGHNTERLCKAFFLHQITCTERSIKPDSTKKSLLIYVGALLNNGIITSFKSLISSIDTSRYKVTILADASHDKEAAEHFFYNLPEEINYIPLNLAVSFTPLDAFRFAWLFFFKKQWYLNINWIRHVWERECRRVLGNTHFDLFINFNGYSWRAAFLSTGFEFPSAIFVHNDMAEEVLAGKIADTRLLELSYRLANGVATVREGCETAYCNQYYNFRHKCMVVPNTLFISYQEKAAHPLAGAFDNGSIDPTFQLVKAALKKPAKHRFINLARFSPEKGQERLIEAFEAVWQAQNQDKVQLFIIGGYGRIEERVRNRARESIASDNIFVIRGSSNPFPLMQSMDTFVLSSFYEGKPITLFEALALDLNIICTDIPGPAALLSQGYGLVVDNSTKGLISGMKAALDSTIPRKPYDFAKHNAHALHQFDLLIEKALRDEPWVFDTHRLLESHS